MNKNLLITVNNLNGIGGTEIESVTTAVFMYDTDFFDKIKIFTPRLAEKNLFEEIIGKRNIEFTSYPRCFYEPFYIYFKKVISKLGFNFDVLQYFYWKVQFLNNSHFYIIANLRDTYFFPIVIGKWKSKSLVLKVAMYHYEVLSKTKLDIYRKLKAIILFNKSQKGFWQDEYNLNQIKDLDIIIPNEINLLKTCSNSFEKSNSMIFGYLGRISKEKNIEDMIYLINFLNKKKKLQCKLLIFGKGDLSYENKIVNLIKELDLSNFIFFKNSFIPPMQTQTFFRKINIFLITSLHEGGPITALEAAAAGRIVMG